MNIQAPFRAWKALPAHQRPSHKSFLFDVQGGLCWLCLQPMTMENATFDHVIPLRHGGVDKLKNLLLAHGRCNHAKGSKLPDIDTGARNIRTTAVILAALDRIAKARASQTVLAMLPLNQG